MQERYARKNEANELRRAFETLDCKKDGRVDAAELAEVFQRLGHKAKNVLPLPFQQIKARGCSFVRRRSAQALCSCSLRYKI